MLFVFNNDKMMKMKKIIFYFLFLQFIFAALPLCADSATNWAPYFKGPDIALMTNDFLTIRYPKVCMVPDKNRVGGALGENEEMKKLEELLNQNIKAKEALQEELKEDLLYGTPSEKEKAEEKIKAAEAMEQSTREEIEKLKIELIAKGTGTKKAKGKEAPAAQPMKEDDTGKYYLQETLNYVGEMIDNIEDYFYDRKNGDALEIMCYVYVVTSPKVWKAIASKPSLVTPVRNLRYDKKNNSILVFASPQNKDQLDKTIAYGVACCILQDLLNKYNENKDAEFAEAMNVGFCANASGLDCVVDPVKVTSLDVLREDKLISPSELFSPRQMTDPVRCLYFTRQCATMFKYIMENGKLDKYFKKATGGNSGFRSSFQYLVVSETWGNDYDDFCNNLTKRVFFPLTDSAQSSPNAMAMWRRKIQDEDDDFHRRRDNSKGGYR